MTGYFNTYRTSSVHTFGGRHIPDIADKLLPCLSGDSVSYDRSVNAYVTDGYTSSAGNTYFKAYRKSDRLVISCDIGIGYKYTFLNGVAIYGYDGSSAKLIGRWTSPCTKYISDYAVKQIAIEIIEDYLSSQAKAAGVTIPGNALCGCSSTLVADTERIQID